MARLSLYAIGITELRDVFGAAPELAERLRQVALERFPVPVAEARKRGSLLGRVGPAMRRPIDPPQVPSRPTVLDVDALLDGRSVPLDRLAHAWQVTQAWLDDLSWGRLDLAVSPQQMSRVEFDLARAGLPASLGLERLSQNNPQLPLRPAPDMQVGYSKNPHVSATRAALTTIIDELDADSETVVGPLLRFLNQFDDWQQEAADQGRPVPDLVVIRQD